MIQPFVPDKENRYRHQQVENCPSWPKDPIWWGETWFLKLGIPGVYRISGHEQDAKTTRTKTYHQSNYKFKNFCVGSTCGRYAGRIENSKFFIGKEKFILSKNDGKNILHGGKIGFDRLVWKKINHTKNKIVYQIKSKHLDEGFPGNLTVNCSYQIFKNKLLIQ